MRCAGGGGADQEVDESWHDRACGPIREERTKVRAVTSRPYECFEDSYKGNFAMPHSERFFVTPHTTAAAPDRRPTSLSPVAHRIRMSGSPPERSDKPWFPFPLPERPAETKSRFASHPGTARRLFFHR